MKRKFKSLPVLFSFDRTEYSSMADIGEIRSVAKTKPFKNLFLGKIVRDVAKRVRAIEYNSYFGGRPKDGAIFFSEMDGILGPLGGTLTYIEITKDTYYPDESSAIAAYEKIKNKVYIKYGRDICYIRTWKGDLSEGFFYREATYFGKHRKFQFVIYPRYCKITNKPVLRMEFRIAVNRRILARLRVGHEKNISDPKTTYLMLSKKYFRYGRLNMNKIEKLSSLRSISVDIPHAMAFQQFRASERKRSLVAESLKYINRLKLSVSYYTE